MQKFEEAYKQLNKEQLQAVETVDGPLLVVAGPGTGKTQLLSMRVAQIMRATDTNPSQILCLTFTNKAAANMRERLFSLVGPESRRVVVKTFHSFAAEIMNRYPDYFWNGAGLSTAPDAVQLEIIEAILFELPLNHPLAVKFAGQYTMVRDVKNGLKLAKEAGLTPAKLRAVIEYNLAYIDQIEAQMDEALAPRLAPKQLPVLKQAINGLPKHDIDIALTPLKSLREVIVESLEHAIALDEPTGKTAYSGIWKKRWIQTVNGTRSMHTERQKNHWWLNLAEVYQSYRNKLHQRGYYDYADMLVEVISQLENNEILRAEIQEQFLYVLIDEFQDTNTAQLRLAHLVADHYLSEGSPNIMAVGDDDQAIYKFNGAELNNMLGFTTSYPSAKLIVLEKNYRSNQEVIQTAERIISLAKDRLVYRVPSLSKNLVSSSQPPIKKGEQKLIIHTTQEHELSAVANELIKLKPTERAEAAVLARSHDCLGRLAYLCLRRGLPVRYEKSSNILEHEAVRQFSLIAEIVVAMQQGKQDMVNSLLQRCLRHPMWGIDPKQLWELACAARDDGNWLQQMAKNKDENLRTISSWLLWLSNETANLPLPLSMEYILGLREGQHMTSPLKKYFTDEHKGSTYVETLSALRLLRGMVQEFSSEEQRSLSDYVELLKVMRNNQQVVADESPFVSGDNAVQLLTVHKAKGLEFERVYIIDCTENDWRPRPARRRPPANLPLQPNGDDEDDYVRLMYVAVTRAKRSVFLYSYAYDSAGNEVVTSPLALAAALDNTIHAEDSSELLPEILEEHLAWPVLSASDEKHMLKATLENFNLNVTGLLNFLDVTRGGPRYFLERNLLRLPEAKTESLSYGTAIHAALEAAQKMTNKGVLSLEKIQSAFEAALIKEHMPPQEFARRLAHGKELLERLFNVHKYQLPEGSLPEERFTDTAAGAALISGSLDRIDIQGDELIVVDYKTGSPVTSLVTNNKSQAVKAWKHRSQLIFYALLARSSPRFARYTKISGQMVYVQSEQAKDLVKSYMPSEEDIKRMFDLVNIVYEKIRRLDLPDTSIYPSDMTGISHFIDDLLAGRV